MDFENGVRAMDEPSSSPVNEGAPTTAEIRRESLLINGVTLLLAEKRTSLSVMRTGLAILALPTSVVSVLIAISRYYDPMKVGYLLGPLLAICLLLTILGIYMIAQSLKRINRLSRMVADAKHCDADHINDLSALMNKLIGPDNDF